jgi:hypothetical protein
MGLIKKLNQKYERELQETADLSLKWDNLNGLSVSPSEAYKKGFVTSDRRHHVSLGSYIGLFVTLSALVGFKGWADYINLERSDSQNQAKQERVVNFYQRNGIVPEGVSPAYLDLRTQLWEREVEGVN